MECHPQLGELYAPPDFTEPQVKDCVGMPPSAWNVFGSDRRAGASCASTQPKGRCEQNERGPYA